MSILLVSELFNPKNSQPPQEGGSTQFSRQIISQLGSSKLVLLPKQQYRTNLPASRMKKVYSNSMSNKGPNSSQFFFFQESGLNLLGKPPLPFKKDTIVNTDTCLFPVFK
jgi:hypothetical protein